MRFIFAYTPYKYSGKVSFVYNILPLEPPTPAKCDCSTPPANYIQREKQRWPHTNLRYLQSSQLMESIVSTQPISFYQRYNAVSTRKQNKSWHGKVDIIWFWTTKYKLLTWMAHRPIKAIVNKLVFLKGTAPYKACHIFLSPSVIDNRGISRKCWIPSCILVPLEKQITS